jgi:multiple sugar transport system substrate-binding protein
MQLRAARPVARLAFRTATSDCPLMMPRFCADARCCLVTLAALACLAAGCAPPKPAAQDPAQAPRPRADLKLLVVDDPAISAAIAALRAEWKARTGSTIEISQMSPEELLSAEALPAVDAIIYPSAQLGPLAERGWIAPLPADYAGNRELAWSDTFELLQVAETTWGQVPHAIPFGSPVLTLYYRADLLERLHKRPPQSWTEFHELAELLSRRENLGELAPAAEASWAAAVQPLARGWASGVLLARAAPYAKHRDNYSTLFHIDTMEPLIAGPPFVRALEELVADAKLGPPNQLELDPAGARREFLAGHAALALAWPGHAASEAIPAAKPPPTGFVELPGSVEVYNIAQQAWAKRPTDESQRVPLLSLSGRLGSVARSSAQPTAAFQLLAWLSGREWGAKVSSASPATTLYRNSQVKAPQIWLDPLSDVAGSQQYATTVRDALSRQAHLFAVRIPGRSQYTAALDTAVHRAVNGEKSSADALSEAAAEWRRITNTLGQGAQRKAYRQSLGLEQ